MQKEIYNVPLPFGKHAGQTVNQLLETKSGIGYLAWAVKEWLPKQLQNSKSWERLPLNVLLSLNEDLKVGIKRQ